MVLAHWQGPHNTNWDTWQPAERQPGLSAGSQVALGSFAHRWRLNPHDQDAIRKDNAALKKDQAALRKHRAKKAAAKANGDAGRQAIDSTKIGIDQGAIAEKRTEKNVDTHTLQDDKDNSNGANPDSQ